MSEITKMISDEDKIQALAQTIVELVLNIDPEIKFIFLAVKDNHMNTVGAGCPVCMRDILNEWIHNKNIKHVDDTVELLENMEVKGKPN